MRTLKLTLAYDGTNYAGWQRQLNGISIQQRLEEAFAPFVDNGPAPDVSGAGRTDAGVHALGQVASVKVDFSVPAAAVQRALNVRLPLDIRVVSVEEAPPGFHARFDARGKTYRYRMATGRVLSPFDRFYVWHAPEPRNVDAMRAAARVLIGRHDFQSFQASGATTSSTARTVDRLDLVETDGELILEISGDGFLRYMVRTIVGTLAEVGTGRRTPESMSEVLAACDRRSAGLTAPASGLTLMEVRY